MDLHSFKVSVAYRLANLVWCYFQTIAKALEGLSVESAPDLQKILRVETYNAQAIVYQRLQVTLPIFRSRMGAMLFLISALLSRGLVRASAKSFAW